MSFLGIPSSVTQGYLGNLKVKGAFKGLKPLASLVWLVGGFDGEGRGKAEQAGWFERSERSPFEGSHGPAQSGPGASGLLRNRRWAGCSAWITWSRPVPGFHVFPESR